MTDSGCIVAGGGPAGMVLGLLLARAGVRVTVLEKHADFLRDFRGDTVHASTLTLLDELGLGEEFAALPHQLVDKISVEMDAGAVDLGLSRIPGRHKHIALVPQWDFLELLASAAERESSFTLLRNAEVTGLLREHGRVVGVRYRDRSPDNNTDSPTTTGEKSATTTVDKSRDKTADKSRETTASTPGGEHELRAALTVGCDGRASTVRESAGVAPRTFGAPVDVWWFRLPRRQGDPAGNVGRFSLGHLVVMLDRGDYWQVAYLIRKGADRDLRGAGIQGLRDEISGLLPWTSDRLDAVRGWDDVKLLDVKVDRMRRWWAEGMLLIGDAAHAMSPVGGVGINLAVADAVATARLLAEPLRSGEPITPAMLKRVQRRRSWPTALIQGGQRLAHKLVLGPQLAADPAGRPKPTELPRTMRILGRHPLLQAIPGSLVAIGPLPEHAPKWARRRPRPASSTAE
ncbi:MAG TPA: FAD-dependent oxidoreductase [Pseudonocardia sp.]|nr:FAD-dependent oxidoreductase [Pseudonocardia sp.]